MSEERKPLKSWAARQAVAILAVDNIKVPDFGYDLLRRREEGLITYEEGKAELVARGHEMAARKREEKQRKIESQPGKIHRIILGYIESMTGFHKIVVVLHGEAKEYVALTPETLKWVSDLKQRHGIPVYGQNNRLPWAYKQQWDSLQEDPKSVD
ncbi:hypothetical protein [Burkholderia cenocepacia]|uniref:hypothetical protein n=1 Tax=Burkholderia cenocepacia TaxID=95486 RepID=UPI001178B790|nr:hypothetical protein [Burkholderia cenocepacia]